MKKTFIKAGSIVALIVLTLAPLAASAAPAQYQPDEGGPILSLNAEACKIADCTDTDWYNYSSTSSTQETDTGNGQTLVVSPGDTLTFQFSTSLTGADGYEDTATPTFGITGTNLDSLNNLNYFGPGLNDLDLDGNQFENITTGQSFDLNSPINAGDPAQVGAVTGVVDANATDGTVITLEFYVINPELPTQLGEDVNQDNIDYNPAGQVYAAQGPTDPGAEYAQSSVRLVVSNPVATPATTLPVTGTNIRADQDILWATLALMLTALGFGAFIATKRAKKIH